MAAKVPRKAKIVRHRLEVYTADDCFSCDHTKKLVSDIINRYTNLQIDLYNLSNPDTILPDDIFATPTYILDGRTIFLGNPSLDELNECFREVGIIMIE